MSVPVLNGIQRRLLLSTAAPVNWHEVLSAQPKKAPKNLPEREKGIEGDLYDLQYDSELDDKYSWWLDHPNLLYQKIREVWAVLVSAAQSSEINGGYSQGRPYTATNSSSFRNNVATAARDIGHYPSTITSPVNSGSVTLGIPMSPIELQLPLPADKDRTGNWKKVEQYISKWFIPGFKMPVSWELDRVGESTKRMPAFQVSEGAPIPIESYTSRNMPDYHVSGYADVHPTKYPHFDEDFDPFKGVASFSFKIDRRMTSMKVEGVEETPEKISRGGIQGLDGWLTLRLFCTLNLKFPLEFALWSTVARSRAEFVPRMFVDYIFAYNNYGANPAASRNEPPPRVTSMQYVRSEVENDQKRTGVSPRKMSNADDFVINRDGTIFWIPEIDDVTNYTALLNSSIDPETGEITSTDKVPNLPNRPIYTDWYNYKFTYTDEVGTPTVINLLGCKPLDEVTVFRKYDLPIDNENFDSFISLMARVAVNSNATYRISQELRPGGALEGVTAPINLANPSFVYNRLKMLNSGDPIQLKHFLGIGTDNDQVDEHSLGLIKVLNWYIQQTHKPYLDTLGKSGPQVINFENRMNCAQFFYWLMTRNQDYWRKVKKTHDDIRNQNIAKPVFDPNKPFKLWNMPGQQAWGMMPHQPGAIAGMRQGSNATLLGIDPGGGKTLIGLVDMTTLIAENNIRRPLVICPGALVSEWVKEISRTGQGNLNPFPIVLRTYRRWTRDLHLSDNLIRKMIQNQPPNTIFITSFEFLRHDVAEDYYSNTHITIPQNAKFIASCGFDYVFEDESQRVRNLEALQTQSVLMITPFVSYVRLASGTLIHDNASDIVGQGAQVNPAMFEDKNRFTSDYGAEFGYGGKVARWVDDIGQALVARTAPYAKWIDIKRREWAWALPTMHENFWPVEMTPNQMTFYSRILREAWDEIRREKKWTKKLKPVDSDEDEDDMDSVDQAELEEALKRKLGPLEIWMNCPAGDDAGQFTGRSEDYAKLFKEMPGVSGKDLISPKVPVVNAILDAHFKGGKYGNVDFGKGDQNKVIIFGFNKVVSRHFYENSKYKNIALHYSTENREALEEFRTNDKYKILYADETSIKEGYNLQMASRMIRLQTLWSPGDQEQMLARGMRPDVRGEYDREDLFFDWLVIEHSLEMAKVSRMIAKIVEKAKVDEKHNVGFNQEIAPQLRGIELVPMGWRTLNLFSHQANMFKHFDAYRTLTSWEERQFFAKRLEVKTATEKRLGKKIKDSQVRKLALLPVDATALITGSKPGYSPYVPNGTPADIYGLDLVPLSKATDEEDEDSEEFENANMVIKPGDLVWTEFGPGELKTLYAKSARVKIQGNINGELNLDRRELYGISSIAGMAKLKRMMNAPDKRKLYPLDVSLFGDQMKLDKPIEPEAEEEAVQTKSERRKLQRNPEVVNQQKKKETQQPLEMHAALINGQLALYVHTDEPLNKALTSGWTNYSGYWETTTTKWNSLDRWLDKFIGIQDTHPKFTSQQRYINEIETVIGMMKKAKNQLSKIKPKNMAKVRDFFRATHSMPKNSYEARPYVFVNNGVVHIAFNQVTQKSIIPLVKSLRVVGMTPLRQKPAISIKFLSNKTQLQAEVSKIQAMGYEIEDEAALKQEIKKLR